MLLNQTRMDNTFVPPNNAAAANTTRTSDKKLFNYIIKEKSKSVIVISSDEGSDDDVTKLKTSTVTRQAQLPQPKRKKVFKRKKQGNINNPISLSDSEQEDQEITEAINILLPPPPMNEDSFDHDMGQDCGKDDEIMFNSINSIEEQYKVNNIDISNDNLLKSSIELNLQEINKNILSLPLPSPPLPLPLPLPQPPKQKDEEEDYEMKTVQEPMKEIELNQNDDVSSLSDIMDLDSLSDEASDLDNDNSPALFSPLSDYASDDISLLSSKREEDLMELDSIIDIPLQQQMKAPSTVDTMIPNNMDCTNLLRTIELYIQSVTEIPPIPNLNATTSATETRTSRRTTRLQDNSMNYYAKYNILEFNSAPYEPINPYVPNRAWYNSTWEDWAQLDVGDILHCPFTDDEVLIIEHCVAKQNQKKRNYGRELVDFWQYVCTLLPGRSPLDCRCFWTDYLEGNHRLYNKPIIIGRQKDTLRNRSQHQLLLKRSKSGIRSCNSMRTVHMANMTRETIISDGSGDAITLAVFKDIVHGVRVAIGSLCDENTQYNMPGNLRLWDSDTKNCLPLRGHQTRNTETGQDIWRTVTDVKMSKDESLIYSASHDGSANIWRASTGKLVSTLQFHCKPINQLAVNYSSNENVLASCSNDGTATIWSIGRNGKTGSGDICELNPTLYRDPRVDCIEFGHHGTENLLFLGINNHDVDHPGYIEVYDIVSSKFLRNFNSMKGCVSTLAVSSSGQYIVSGNYNRYDNMSGDGFIHLHDNRQQEVVSKFFSGHPDVNIVAISPCEKYVASGNADKEKSEVLVFDVRNPRRVLHTLSHNQTLINQSLIAPDSSIGIGGLHWMSDSRTILTGGGDSTVKVWSIEGATRLLKSYQTTNCVTSLTVHEDTMTIAAGVAGAQGIVHVWQP